MAKSIHSKHKIKMRNEKRKRYYVRELNNLKKLVTEREARRALGEYSNSKFWFQYDGIIDSFLRLILFLALVISKFLETHLMPFLMPTLSTD